MLRNTISSWRPRVARRFGVPLALLGLVTGFSPLTATIGAHASTMQNYIVLYGASAVPADAAASIARAGGSLVYSYNQIGVAIARSDSASFRANVVKDNRVEGASATAAFATQLKNNMSRTDDASGPQQGDLPNSPATDADTLSPLQWDMRQIKTPQAHAITGGSPAVLVGDIDTGLDYTHPDLASNVDDAASVNCVSGAPVPGMVAANDDNGHGTHTAGTIAAAANGFGIVGVAPNVRIAGIKAGDAAGFFFPEAVICAFVWAGTHHVDVTNNSYFADPFLFNCRNDPVQRAIWKAEQRAIRFAQQQGTLVVAAEGNEGEDLSHPTVDATSPDDTTPVTRAVTNACVVIPVEISGVVGVAADGNTRQIDRDSDPNDFQKSFYSNYGVATTDVVAPGGDSVFGRTAEAANGRVLSTWPAALGADCLRPVMDPGPDPGQPAVWYCYLQGTSMASPHVAGVAALIISQFGQMPQGRVEAYIGQTADPQPCPTAFTLGFAGQLYSDFGAGTESGAPPVCQGGPGHNSWYGSGQVDALNAVTHTTGS
jgi:subtilisin family serine protease